MNALSVASLTAKLLRRQQWFYTALVLGIVMFLLAQLAGGLVPEESQRITSEAGSLSFLALLVITASYWGSTLFPAGKAGGTLEFQLNIIANRTSWALGRYLGLVCAMLLMAVSLFVLWTLLLQITSRSLVSSRELVAFEFDLLNALVVATLAMFLSNFLDSLPAAMVALTLWGIGMNTSVANYWNLQRLNPGARLSSDQLFTTEQLISATTYGVSMLLILLVCSCFIFSKRQ